MATFVLNDENKVNSYGFKILNAGIDLKRFKANPVVLDQHYNSTWAVIGKWTNIRIEGSKLLADAEFDTEDEDAKKIAGKVDRGFIKGASMGVSFDREAMKQNPKNEYELSKCELYEASIVAIPSNANSLRLYAGDGNLIPESEVKLAMTELFTPQKDKNTPQNMSKITLSVPALAALGLENSENEADVSAKIVTLSTKLKNTETALEVLQKKVKADQKLKVDAFMKEGKLSGQITALNEAKMLAMAEDDLAQATEVLSWIPKKETLGDKTKQTLGAGEIKTDEDFQKLSYTEQLAWKEANPEAYKKLFA